MKFYMIAFLSAAIVASNFVAKAESKNVKTVTTKKAIATKSLSQDDVFDALTTAASQVQIGGVYSSLDDQYMVLCVALDALTSEALVVYESLTGVNGIWVSSVTDFADLVGLDLEDDSDVSEDLVEVALEEVEAALEFVENTFEGDVDSSDALVATEEALVAQAVEDVSVEAAVEEEVNSSDDSDVVAQDSSEVSTDASVEDVTTQDSSDVSAPAAQTDDSTDASAETTNS